MGKYLSAYLSSVPVGQRRAMLQLLERDKASGKISTKEEFDQSLQKMVEQLSAGKNFTTELNLTYPVDPIIGSDMFNNNFRSFFVALHGLFHQMNKADATVTRHRAVRRSDFTKLKAGINKLVEDISVFRYLRSDEEGWSEARFSNFSNRRNANTTIQAAEVDEQTHNLRLRIGQARRLHQLTGSRPAKAYIEQIGGGQQDAASKSFEPGNILDNKLDTFWAHLVLADEPLRTVVDGVGYDGALVWVVIETPNVEPVSYLNLMPFGSHPVEVLQLEYWTGAAWADVSGWTPVSATLDWQEFGFEEVQTNKVRVLLRQENYTKNTYLIPRRLFTTALLWEMVTDQQLLQGVTEEELTGAQQIAVETNPRFRALMSALKRWDDRLGDSGLNIDSDAANELTAIVDAATAIMAGTRESDAQIITRQLDGETNAEDLEDTDVIEITKVEYLLGLYHASLEHRNYLPAGVYESPKYENTGVPYEVALDVDDSHVTQDDNGTTFNRTSIEYEVEIAPERRVPILPYGQLTVPQEVLKVDLNSAVARTRFAFAQLYSVAVRENGRAMAATEFTASMPNSITIPGFKRNAIYTADYTAAAGSDLFDIDAVYDSQSLDQPEIFTETDDSGLIRLNYYPYLAWEIINDDENWYRPDPEHARYYYRVENGDVTIDNIVYGPNGLRSYDPISVKVNGILAQNLTQYRKRIQPAFVETAEEIIIYQYIHVGRKIYLSRPVTGATIEVSYNWIGQYTRLVATLRGHQPVFNPYTPLLRNYRIRSKTSRL
jgi:hypothetical protein